MVPGARTLKHTSKQRRRWSLFLVALGGSALLAVGFAVGIDRLLARPEAAPRLRTVPAGVLAGAGVTVAAPGQPPYCDVERSTVQPWTGTGQAGCAISLDQAKTSLLPVFRSSVREAVLARVSGPPGSPIGRDRLVWLVVLRSDLLQFPTNCAPVAPNGAACRSRDLGPTSNEAIEFIDATTGEVITAQNIPASALAGAAG